MARRQAPQSAVPSLYTPHPADRGDIAHSASARGDEFERTSFNLGIDRSVPPNLISKDSARKIRNMWFPKEGAILTTRPGLEPLISTPADGAITALCTYLNPIDNKTYIVFTSTTVATDTYTFDAVSGVNPATDTITVTGTAPAAGTAVRVRLDTSNALPAGLSATTTYYVINDSGSDLQLSATEGGSAVDITADGGAGNCEIYSVEPGTDQEVHFIEVGDTTIQNLETTAGNGVQAKVGSNYTPSLITYNGKVILGVRSEPIKVWEGRLSPTESVWTFHGVTNIDFATEVITASPSPAPANGTKVMVRLTTSSAFPTGLAANTPYYVIDSTGAGQTFKLSTIPNGTAVNLVTGAADGELEVYTITARAKATVTVGSQPATSPADTLTVGGSTWTFKTSRALPFEIASVANTTTQAEYIAAAINEDSFEVRATSSVAVVTIEACKTGAAGNSLALSETGSSLTTFGFVGGVNGQVLDEVDTYEAPTDSAVVLSDRNQRLIVAGPESPRVYFSTPGNEFSFASGVYGYGEYWDLGTKESNYISAIALYAGEVWAHKHGENREIHRMKQAGPTETWSLENKAYTDIAAAISPRAAVSATQKHVVLDRKRIHIFTGTDTYDEVRPIIEGNKINDLFTEANSTAFIAKDPENLVLYIFPAAPSSECLVYHYGTGRWTIWDFQHTDINCAVYCESLGTMLFGGSDGLIYQFNDRAATDYNGTDYRSFSSEIIGRTMDSDDLVEFVVKQVQIDYTNRVAGTGRFGFSKDRSEAAASTLFEFSITTTGLTLDQLHALGAITPLGDLYFTNTAAYSKVIDFTQDTGTDIAPHISFTGAADINRLVFRYSRQGRDL